MLNRFSAHGRLTGDPELRKTDSGKSVCKFTLAVDRDFSKEKKADFFTCVAWEKRAEFIDSYFSKGQEAIVHGRIETRSFADKDGKNRTVYEVAVESIDFCGSKREMGETPETPKKPVFEELSDDTELPF